MISHNAFALIERIVEMSVADTWPVARREWSLTGIFHEQDGKCLCGHHPITEHCVLHNHLNHKSTIVGCVCVKYFTRYRADLLFKGIERLTENIDNPMNSALLEFALDREWINNWEDDFYLDTFRKRNLTAKQREIRRRINTRVMKCVRNSWATV